MIEIGNRFHNSVVYVVDIKWWEDRLYR